MDRCVACGGRLGGALKYLCTSCWYALPPVTRWRLRESGGAAIARARLVELLTALQHDVPLAAIEVAGGARSACPDSDLHPVTSSGRRGPRRAC